MPVKEDGAGSSAPACGQAPNVPVCSMIKREIVEEGEVRSFLCVGNYTNSAAVFLSGP